MATRRGLVATAALALAACEASEPTDPVRLHLEPLARPAVLAGGGVGGIVLLHQQGQLHLYRQDPTDLDALVELAILPTGAPTALGLSATRAALLSGQDAVVVDHTASPPVARAAALSALPLATCLVPGVAADGRWLLGSNGGTLELVDVDQPATRASYAVRSGCATRLLAAHGAFLAFTTGGWVQVSPGRLGAGYAFVETTSAALGTVRAAFADGVEAVLAGEGTHGGSWVARVDLRALTPYVLHRIDLDTPFGAFAWDGSGMSVLQGVESPPGASRRYGKGWVVRELGHGFRASPVELPSWAGSGCSTSPGGQVVCDEVPGEHLAASLGRLFALTGPPHGFGWYRLR